MAIGPQRLGRHRKRIGDVAGARMCHLGSWSLGSLSGTRVFLFLFTSQIISTLASRFQRQPSVSCTACTFCSARSPATSLSQARQTPRISRLHTAALLGVTPPTKLHRTIHRHPLGWGAQHPKAGAVVLEKVGRVRGVSDWAGRCDENCQPDCCTGKRRVPFPSRVRLAALSPRSEPLATCCGCRSRPPSKRRRALISPSLPPECSHLLKYGLKFPTHWEPAHSFFPPRPGPRDRFQPASHSSCSHPTLTTVQLAVAGTSSERTIHRAGNLDTSVNQPTSSSELTRLTGLPTPET